MLLVPLLNENRFRLKVNRRYHTESIQSRRVSLPIQSPVLFEYNYINLQKNNHQKRINHVSACLPIPARPARPPTSPNKWQESLNRYMFNKEKIQTRKGSLHNQFQFMKLNKRNRYRKKKLAEELSIPIDSLSTTFLGNTVEQQPISQSYNMKNSIKLKKDLVSLKHIYHSPQARAEHQRKISGSPHSSSPESQQERILNQFVTSYFKKKYKRSKQFLGVLGEKEQRRVSASIETIAR